MGKVIISRNPVKTSQRIDFNGNIIDPRSKQIIVAKEENIVYSPPAQPEPSPQAIQAPITPVSNKSDGLSVLEQIEATKKHLQDLEELKRLKIAEKRKELELLEQ